MKQIWVFLLCASELAVMVYAGGFLWQWAWRMWGMDGALLFAAVWALLTCAMIRVTWGMLQPSA